MKIIFLGTPSLSVPVLDALYKSEHSILAVVTQPDKRQGRKQTLVASPVKEYAIKNNIPVFQPEKVGSRDFLNQMKELKPDVMVLVAYGQMIGKTLLSLAPWGILNVHYSLLPKYRGASPLSAAILAGEKETGVTIMRLVRAMDAGPILAQQTVEILPTDTREMLENKSSICGAELLLKVLHGLPNSEYEPKEQNEEEATFCTVLEKKEGIIPWEKSATYLDCFVRAMNPWPMAYSALHRARAVDPILVWEACVHNVDVTAKPGTIINIDRNGIEVATGENALYITKLQKAGRNAMSTAEFLRGTHLEIGDYFAL